MRGHGDGGAIAAHGDGFEPVMPVLGLGVMDQAVGVHVEGDRTGEALAIRPGEWVEHHGRVLQGMAAPPSTPKQWPVMKLAPGEARKTMTAATSSGRPMRPSG